MLWMDQKLEPFDESCSPRFFGMYAVEGMGKTTMSRVLCNELSSKFLAKVCHVELNNHAIIDLRKALLRTLTKWSEIDMSKLTDESQVQTLSPLPGICDCCCLYILCRVEHVMKFMWNCSQSNEKEGL
jgi:hypothetical protein